MKTNKLSFLLKALFALALSLQLNMPTLIEAAATTTTPKAKSAKMTIADAMKTVNPLAIKAKRDIKTTTKKALEDYNARITSAVAELEAANADASRINEAQAKTHAKLQDKEADALKTIDKGGLISGPGVIGLQAFIKKSITELTSMTSGAKAQAKLTSAHKDAEKRVDQLVKAALAGDIEAGKVKPGVLVKNPQKSLFGSSTPKARKKIMPSLLWAAILQGNIDKIFTNFKKDATGKFVTLEKYMTAAKAKINRDVTKKSFFGKDTKISKAVALKALEASFKEVRTMLANNIDGAYNDLIEKTEKTLKEIEKKTKSVKDTITKEQTKHKKTVDGIIADAEKDLAKNVEKAKTAAENAQAAAQPADDEDAQTEAADSDEDTETEADETTDSGDSEDIEDTQAEDEGAEESEDNEE